MAKRYDYYKESGVVAEPSEYPSGSYVYYRDHESEIATLQTDHFYAMQEKNAEIATLREQLAEEKAGRAESNSVAETRLGEIGDLREQLKSHEVAYAAVLETAREMGQRLELAEQQLHGVDMAGKLTSGDLFMLNMTVRILEEAYLGALVGERLRGIIGKLTRPTPDKGGL